MSEKYETPRGYHQGFHSRIRSQIDYRTLVEAQDHYSLFGFKEINVPWTVSEAAIKATVPDWVNMEGLTTPWGVLIGSAEQGFLQLAMDGALQPGRYQAITPCWRPEKTFGTLQHPYFMKLELMMFGTDAMSDLHRMLEIASSYFNGLTGLKVREEKIQEDQIDLVYDAEDNTDPVEVGSYGIRKYDNHRWVYGTGLAEPRFSSALMLQYGNSP